MIYAIECGDAIKFGVAKNPHSRLRELQTGNPHKLRLIAVVAMDNEIERNIHAYCAADRIGGEWFRRAGHAVQVATEMIQFQYGVCQSCAMKIFTGQKEPPLIPEPLPIPTCADGSVGTVAEWTKDR